MVTIDAENCTVAVKCDGCGKTHAEHFVDDSTLSPREAAIAARDQAEAQRWACGWVALEDADFCATCRAARKKRPPGSL